MTVTPISWDVSPLEKCVEAIIDYRGKSPKKVGSGVPLVTAKVVKNGRILQPDEFIAESEYDAWMRRGLPRAKDVLMTTEAPLGEVAQVKDERIALAQRLILLRGKPGILDSTYLKFAMQSSFVQEQLHARSTGTTVLGIRQSELRKVLMPLPPLAEQRRIAEILGALDDKIELNRRMNDTLEAIARAIFNSTFEDVDEEGPITTIAEVISGGTPSTERADYWNGDIPWASAKDISQCGEPFLIRTERSITTVGLSESATTLVEPLTSVVVARGATTGRMAMFGSAMAMNQTCYGLRAIDGDHYFLFCLLRDQMDGIVHAAHGSVFDTITTSTLKSSRVPLPKRAERLRFHAVIEPFFVRILANENESLTLASLRDTLLPKLLSGEIRVGAAEKEVAEVV